MKNGPILRDYQNTGVAEIRAAYGRKVRRVLFVLPTGGGKTVTFSYIASEAAKKGKRIIIVAHRREIVEQISRSLAEMGVRHSLIVPQRPITEAPVMVGMVQTLAKRLHRVCQPDLLVIDEAHHSITGTYKRVTDHWPKTMLLGVSATPERLDGRGLKDAFDEMITGPSMRWLIENGYLAGYDYFAPTSKVDLSRVRTRGGDFAVGDLAEVMDKSVITGDAVEHYRDLLNGRPAVAFCVSVRHAEHVAEQFMQAGFRAASVDGSMTPDARRQLLVDLAEGRLNVLTSCELISEGVDVPVCAGAILLRPTKSVALYLQQIGRALRKKPDGSRAVILDHVGNVHRFGMPDTEREWTLEGRKKRAAAQAESLTTCPTCFRAVPSSQAQAIARTCGGTDGAPCGLIKAADEEPARKLEVVEGRLEKVTDLNAWAQGIDIAKARGATFFRLLDLAGDDEERLKAVQKARGFRRGWHKHRAAEFRERQGKVQNLLAQASPQGPDLGGLHDDVLWSLIRTVDDAVNGGPTPTFAGMRYWAALRQRARDELSRRRCAA